MFDINYPEEPPDFIFGLEDFCPDIYKIQVIIHTYMPQCWLQEVEE